MIKKTIMFTLLLAIGLILYVAFLIVDYSVKSVVVSSDAAIILGAAVINDQPSPVFKERINHGITLYKSGVVKQLIFTGGVGKGQSFSESEVARTYAIRNGVQASDILIEQQSTITYENFLEAKKIIKQTSIKRILVVSDPLHMKRAMSMAHQFELNAQPAPTPTSRYKTWSTKSSFLTREVFFYIGYILRRRIL